MRVDKFRGLGFRLVLFCFSFYICGRVMRIFIFFGFFVRKGKVSEVEVECFLFL